MAEYKDVTSLKKEIADFKKVVGSPNSVYLTGYICALSATEGMIANLPNADVVEVVRCKDCKHWRYETAERIEHYECNIFCGAYGRGYPTGADDFCSYGERKK